MSDLIPDAENYFKELVPARDELLLRLEAEAAAEEIPIVGPVVGELLYLLVRTMGAKQVLELGTATGYSGLYLARACLETGGRLTTVEGDPRMAERAKGNIEAAGLEASVKILRGDAKALLKDLKGPFDLVFLDIEKEDYAVVLDDGHRLLRRAGLLVADNTAFLDAKAFNRAVLSHAGFRTVHLFSLLPLHSPERDALCLALKA